jgi:cytochrome bd-type quinol oxidase subunit 1
MEVAHYRRSGLSAPSKALGERNGPQFMQYADSVIGMPFCLEGFAFFTEAIFLGIYLYGWNRVPGWLHLILCPVLS